PRRRARAALRIHGRLAGPGAGDAGRCDLRLPLPAARDRDVDRDLRRAVRRLGRHPRRRAVDHGGVRAAVLPRDPRRGGAAEGRALRRGREGGGHGAPPHHGHPPAAQRHPHPAADLHPQRLRVDPHPRGAGLPRLRHRADQRLRMGLRPQPRHVRRGQRHRVDGAVPGPRERAGRARGDPRGRGRERPQRPAAAHPAPAPTQREDGGRMNQAPARLEIRDLDIRFATDGGEVHAVDGVSLEVAPGEILAVVGESGSGKSVTARSVLGLLPETADATGTVLVSGTDVVRLSAAQMRRLRGEDVSMIFQEPSSALNPVFPIWWQIGEGLRAHRGRISRKEIRAEAVRALESVGIPDAAERIDRYPHEFSGGQKQRIMIAMALALGAELIVADEPTTALDVTVQAEILDLLRDVRDRFGTSIILITHNMGVVADLADSVAVMHHGRVVERATATELFADPREEYTQKLLAAVPHLGRDSAWSALEPAAQQALEEAEPLVVARDLVVEYPGRLGRAPFRAVKGVDLTIRRGEVYGLVGESGS